MSKSLILTTLIVLSIVSSFAIIPGLAKSSIGGNFIYVPLMEAQGFGIDFRYQEGLMLHSFENFGDVYGFGGVGFAYDSFNNSFEVRIPVTFLWFSNKFNFEIFKTEVMPALTVDSYIGYDTKKGFTTSLADIYISLLGKLNNKGKYLSIYFWPFPILVGFNITQF
jgi:hypothetical protein